MAVRKDQVQINISFLTDESKAYAKLIQDNDKFIKDLKTAQKNGQDLTQTIKNIATAGQSASNISLDKVTSSQLVSRARQLQQVIQLIPRSAPEYAQLEGELKLINDNLATMRTRTRGVADALTEARGAGSLLSSVFTGIFSTFGGLSLDNLVGQVTGYIGRLFTAGTAGDFFLEKTRTVFGEAEVVVQASAQAQAHELGLTQKAYIDLATAAGDLLIPMGFLQKDAAQLSTRITEQAGVLSEWQGGLVSAEQAHQIITKALLGERDALNTLGLDIKDSLIQDELKRKGLNDLTGESRRQAEALVTLDLITQQSAQANENYEKNTDSLVRTKARLRARIGEISDNLAKALVPAFGFVLRVGEKVLTFIIGLAKGFADIPRFVRENQVAIGAIILALVSLNAQSILATANTLRLAAVQRGAAIATAAQATAQRILNLVMTANPIGLVIAAISLLVAGFKIAYDRSENFRAAIAGVGSIATEVFTIIKEALSGFVTAFEQIKQGDFKGAFSTIGDSLVRLNPIGIAFKEGDRLKAAFMKGYEDSKLKSAQDREAEEFQKNAKEQEDDFKESGKGVGAAYSEGLVETLLEELKKGGSKSAEVLSKETKKALDARLKEIQLAIGREEIALEAQRLNNQVSEQDFARRSLELKQQQYQQQLAAFKEFNALQTKEALAAQAALQQIQATLAPRTVGEVATLPTRGAPVAAPGQAPQVQSQTGGLIQQIETETQLQNELLRQRFEQQFLSELQYEELLAENRLAASERQLEMLRESGLQNTELFQQTLQENLAAQEAYNETMLENKQRTIELEQAAELARLDFTSDAIQVGIDLLSKDENAKRKHAGVIKAFEIGNVFIDLYKEISGIWRNANSNPINSLIPGFGTAFAIAQTALATARAAISVRKISSQKFSRGGIPQMGLFGGKPHSRGGTKGVFDDGTVVEVEEGEIWAVLNKNSSGMLRRLSNINKAGGGKEFAYGGALRFQDGGLTTISTTPSVSIDNATAAQSAAPDFTPLLAEFRAMRQAFMTFPTTLKAKVVYGEYEEVASDVAEVQDRAAL